MTQDNNRHDLSGERADLNDKKPIPASRIDNPATQPPRSNAERSSRSGGFDLNQPTIISLLYIAGYVTVVSALVGLVLAYVWRSEPNAEWESSHYDYLIRTFWIGVLGTLAGIILTIVLIGPLVLLGVAVLVLVRTVMALLAAQKHEAMPHPDSWLL